MRAQSLHLAFSLALIVAACADDDAATATSEVTEPSAVASVAPDGGTAPADSQPSVERPDGWDEASHGRGAEADYARLFDGDVVRRIDFKITPEARMRMLDDMTMLIGKLGAGRGFGPAPDPKACGGKKAGDSCTDMAAPDSGERVCRSFNDMLACIPKDFGGANGGKAGLDLIGGDPVYVPITVELDGKRWEQVGMRYKGNSSLRGAWSAGKLKLGFRLNFDHFEGDDPRITDQRFFGFSELTFSPAYGDPALIRDKLAGELAADFGLVTARCAFYRVYVDAGEGPEYWGLYTMIEDPSDELLESQFDDASGNMYKPDGPGAAFTEFDTESFAKKTNQDAADYSDVQAMFDALNAPRDDAARWRAKLEKVFDVDNFLKVLAFSRSIGHWDGYGVMSHNYYLYADPTRDGRLVWISWDHNLTWQASMSGPFPTLSVMMDDVTDRWPLIRFILDDAVYRKRYLEALDAFSRGAYQKSRFDARAKRLYELLSPYVRGDEGERAPYTALGKPEDFDRALDDPMRGLLKVADDRRKDVQQALSVERSK